MDDRVGTGERWKRPFDFPILERPILAQIYGADPDTFYQVAHILCPLGFDGVDINMGCPAKGVAGRGCGAALIKNPPLARQIIRAVQAGIRDWAGGHTLETIGLRPSVVEQVQRLRRTTASPQWEHRSALPVSVKTRLGYDTVVIEDWVATLLEERPEVIAIHAGVPAEPISLL